MNIYIDSENISPRYFDIFLERYLSNEIAVSSIKVFADFNDSNSNTWYSYCRTNIHIIPTQCMKKIKMGTIDNTIFAHILDDVLIDKERKFKLLKKILIISSDSDYIPFLNKLKNHGYNTDLYNHKINNKIEKNVDIEKVNIKPVVIQEIEHVKTKKKRKKKSNSVLSWEFVCKNYDFFNGNIVDVYNGVPNKKGVYQFVDDKVYEWCIPFDTIFEAYQNNGGMDNSVSFGNMLSENGIVLLKKKINGQKIAFRVGLKNK